ncbi:MAG: iron-containing alcohol dehydrogenase [Eubacterium sp.]|nr:iron-containing alcohol dehydrogenase [Eubacterium sp.]
MDSFGIKTQIYFGNGALSRLKEIPYRKVLIITDPFVVQSKMIDLITKPLSEGGITYELFYDVVPDAPLDKISNGVKKFLEYKPEAIVAVGGGSAIDSSKAIREFALKIEPYGEVGLIAIPTTSGTGSEVTSFAVVNDTTAKVKYPLVSERLTAEEAILDAELVKSVPPAITADTGMDVFTHALEAYVSTAHNEFSSALAEKAIEICGVFLLRAYLDGSDMHARQKMHVASCLAGLAFNSASLGITHSMAHQLGALFHIPHGRANAMLLPHIVEFNANINKHSRSQKEYLPSVKRYANIAHILGLSNYNEVMSVRSLVNWIQFMQKEMNIPLTIQEIGTITPDAYFAAVDKMADAALADACTPTNPRVPTKEDIIKIYTKLWSF